MNVDVNGERENIIIYGNVCRNTRGMHSNTHWVDGTSEDAQVKGGEMAEKHRKQREARANKSKAGSRRP
jgi:hypothetical protein